MLKWSSYRDGLRRFLRNHYFWYGLLALVVVVGAVYLGFDRALMPRVTRHGASVTVPDVRSLTAMQADSILFLAGLGMEQQLLRKLNLPRDQIIDQRPTARSQVKPGRTIFVTINTGDTTTVQIPDVIGRSQGDVAGYLREQFGLEAEVLADSVRSSVQRDAISRQLPEAGERRPRGTVVRLWYSLGPSAEFVKVPSVSGLSVEEARQRLTEVGLRSVILGPDSGPVRDQGPDSGTTVRVGSEVRLRTRARDDPPTQ